jgi:Anti-sigma factor NepR
MQDAFNPRRSGAFSEWTISAEQADARIARAIRICVANHLRQMYGEILKEPIPPRIAKLLRRLVRGLTDLACLA